MSKVRIDTNERYPFYSLTEGIFGEEVEATEEQVKRWELAMEQFETAQDEMGALYGPAVEAQRAREAAAKAEREAAEKAKREQAARERETKAKAEEAKRDAMWQQLQASGGVVYDAEGNRIGTIEERGWGGVTLSP